MQFLINYPKFDIVEPLVSQTAEREFVFGLDLAFVNNYISGTRMKNLRNRINVEKDNVRRNRLKLHQFYGLKDKASEAIHDVYILSYLYV